MTQHANIKALESMDSIISIWMARLLKHVNTNPHRFELAAPLLVLRVRIVHGPNISRPTFMNGGATSNLWKDLLFSARLSDRAIFYTLRQGGERLGGETSGPLLLNV